MIIGIASIVALASFIPIWASALPPTAYRVTNCGIVIRFSLRMTMIGHKTSFQDVMNVMMPTVINVGTEIGHKTWKRIRNSLQPSIHAASIRSCGIEIKCCLKSMMANALSNAGIIRAANELVHPNSTIKI